MSKRNFCSSIKYAWRATRKPSPQWRSSARKRPRPRIPKRSLEWVSNKENWKRVVFKKNKNNFVLQSLQLLEDQKKKLDIFCDQSYKNVSSLPKSFVFPRIKMRVEYENKRLWNFRYSLILRPWHRSDVVMVSCWSANAR